MTSALAPHRYRLPAGLLVAVTISLACEEEMMGDQPPPPPTVTGVSATTLAPGDTLVVTGTNFLSPPDENRVFFNNASGVSIPFAGSATQLSVVVDQDALSGRISVTVTDQPQAGVGPNVVITRGVGDVWVYGDNDKPLELSHPTALTQYLVIPHATNPAAPYTQNHPYAVASENAAPPVFASADGVGDMTPREAFDAWRWEEAARHASAAPDAQRLRERGSPASTEASQFRQFFVLNTPTGATNNPANFTVVTALQRYSGSRCIIYSDVDTLSTGNLTQSDFDDFGNIFDTQIDSVNVAHFGGYSDVDGNGRVIILVSPVVNRLTPPSSSGFIGGFFLFNDLFAPGVGANPGTTNFGEIFYVLAADPAAQWGNPFPPNFTAQENVKTIAHEHEHLISFSHRLFNQDRKSVV